MNRTVVTILSLALAAMLIPGLAFADGLGALLGSRNEATQAENAAQPADAPQAEAAAQPEDILPKVIEALGNDVYSQTLQALQGGEVITPGTQSQAAAGLQQTLVDLGSDIAVDGDAGQLTFGALNQLLGILKMEPVDSVNADLYAQLLPLVLIAQKADVADDLLRGTYASAEESSQYDYVRGCVLLAQGRNYSAKEAFESSRYDDYEQRAQDCLLPWPASGEMWHNPGMYYSEMSLSFIVNSRDESRGRYFEVYAESGDLAATLFLTGSGTVTTYLPGGNYHIRDCSGYEWYGMKEIFGPESRWEYMKFWEFEGDDYLTALPAGYDWSISINVTESSGAEVGSDSVGWGVPSVG